MVRVRVPATSANMGPGFDSLGIAFNLYNEFEFEEINDGLEFEGIPEEFCNTDNIIYEAMVKCFSKGNYKFKGLKIKLLKQDIPISRGLGSSSSCIIGGLIGANALMDSKLSKEEIFNIGVDMEGHPDNIAPALFGGMVIAVMEEGRAYYNLVEVKDGVKFLSIIPDFRLQTTEARAVLPTAISRADAVYNIGRAALMVSAFSNGRYDLIKFACKDAIHQNYRSKLIKHFDSVYNKMFELDAIGGFLSGAGPTLMAMYKNEDLQFRNKMDEYLSSNNIVWETIELEIDNLGARVIEGEYE